MPAVAVAEGCCDMVRVYAAAGVTIMLLDTTVFALAVKVKVTVAALVTYNPLNVATPEAVVAVGAVSVPFKLPPLVSLAVTVVPLLTRLPY